MTCVYVYAVMISPPTYLTCRSSPTPPHVHTHTTPHSTFSYAYKFETNQGTFIACKFDVFTSDDIPQPEGWTGDNWTGA